MKTLNLILFILCNTIVTAQTLKVTADKNPAIVGEQILLQFTIDTESDNFKSPKFKNLQVLSGPNSSSQSSYTFSNGKSQSNTSTTYSFYLKALSKGVFTIPSASVEVKGKTIKRFPDLLSFFPKLKSVLVNLNIWAKYRKYILVELIRLTVAYKKPKTLNNARYT